MSPSDTPQTGTRRAWYLKPLRWLVVALLWFCRFLLLAWAALALYYSKLPWPAARMALAVAFLVFGIWALWFARGKRSFLVFTLVYLGIVGWWATIHASHDRPWRAEVAVMPRVTIDGDRVHISGFRNFKYRSRDDFDRVYEERDFLLSHLTSVDLYVSYWAVGPVGHTFVSFNFDNAEPLCISIETRPEVGEGFDPLASLFKEFELIYVVGDERDLVGLRAVHRNEDVFLYRVRATPEAARRLLLVYLERINQLADTPEWYHLLSNSCTINIIRYARQAGRTTQFDIRHLLNGFIDQYLYASGKLDGDSLPFDDLRKQSHINDAVKAADGAGDFPQRIRAGLPKPGA